MQKVVPKREVQITFKSIWNGTLSMDSVKFADKASVTKYMVAKEH